MESIFSVFTEVRDINRIMSALRSCKWLYDENERQRLVEQVKNYEEPLMKEIMGIGHLDHAFLELAALGGIGADWLLDKYNDDALCNQVIGATSKHQSIMGSLAGDNTRCAAGILLIELSRLTNTRDNIPHILDAAKNLAYTKETNFIKWFFTRLWIFIDDERVVDYLIGTLDKDQNIQTIHYLPDVWNAFPTFDPSDTIIAMIGEDIGCHPSDTPPRDTRTGILRSRVAFVAWRRAGYCRFGRVWSEPRTNLERERSLNRACETQKNV